MKKTATYFLLAVYLLTATGFSELLKVDFLVEHYYDTKQGNASLSVLDFLEMHYVSDDANRQDNETDKKLPFKCCEVLLDIIMTDIISYPHEFVFAHFEFPYSKITIHSKRFLITNYPLLVWHPPQIA